MTITNLGFAGGFANLGLIDLQGTLGVASSSHIYGTGTLASETVPSVIKPFNTPTNFSDFPNLPAALKNTLDARLENDGNTISGAIQITVPVTNKGTINANSTIGALQIIGDVANYGLLEASPPVVSTATGPRYLPDPILPGQPAQHLQLRRHGRGGQRRHRILRE